MATEIRVDPQLLRELAGELGRAAQVMLGAAIRIGSAVDSASGYEGQLESQVSAIAGGDGNASRQLAEELAGQSEWLNRIADGFEEADSLEAGGRVGLAASLRALVEHGFDRSVVPQWLFRGGRPPWMSPRLWRMLPEEDQQAILESLETAWLGYVYGPQVQNLLPGARLDSGFVVHLYIQGEIPEVPDIAVWQAAARHAGMSLVGYVSTTTGINTTTVEAWTRAAHTHDFELIVPVTEMADMARAGESFETFFGYTVEGDWTDGDASAISEGVLMVSYALADATPGSEAPHTVFKSFFEDAVFTLKEEGLDQGWYCSAGGYGARCEPLAEGHMSPQLLAHELGHTFNARVTNLLNAGAKEIEDRLMREQLLDQVPSLTPYGELRNTEITAEIDGEVTHVSGRPPEGGYERTDLGFASLGRPWQQHSIRWDDNGNTANEDFADMFLGWAFDGFSDDSAGDARYAWMESNMPDWIAQGTQPLDLAWFETANP